MEITEDAEENAPDKDEPQAQSPASEMPHRPFSQRSDATVTASQRAPSRLQQTTSVNDQPESETNTSDVSSTIDHFPAPPSATFDHRSERASQRNFRDDLSNAPSDSRRFSQSSRPSMRDLDHISPYTTPKVKRGPRPSVESSSRPRSQDQRPVASLPAGVRSSALRRPKPNTTPLRPRSQGNPVASSMSGKGAAPGVPPLLVPPLSMPISRPQISPGAKSLSAVSASGLSPEKERLMRALQQRKKQMEKRSGQNKQNTDENKENVGYEQLNQGKGATTDRTLPVDNYKNRSDQSTEPRKEATSFISPVQSKPDSVVDMVVSDSDGDQLSSTTPTTTITTPSIATPPATTTIHQEQNNNNLNNHDDDVDDNDREEGEAPTATDFPIPVSSSAGVDDSKTQDGPRSPSAADGPLQNKSRNTPENEIVVSPPPTNPPPNSAEQEADAAPETLPRPDTSTIPNSSSNSTAPIDNNSQHDSPTPESSDAVRQDVTERRDKRKPYLEPIQVPTPEYSDEDNLLSDDSFMEELKSATVQEAKPVSVGSPVVTDNGDEQPASSSSSPEAWVNSRAVSNPTAPVESQSSNLQVVTGGRSVSSTYPEAAGPMSPALVARKVNVSSGISKRIKALEKFSGNRDVPATATPPNLVGSHASSFDTFRKRASISKPSGNSDSPSISRSASTAARPVSQAASFTRDDSQSNLNGTQATSSVSVTARIVRDADGGSSDNQLQASPLTVEHEISEDPVSPNLTAESATDEREKRSMSTSSAGSGNQSLAATIQRSESRMSVSSKGEGEEKKASRTSRLLHRMSSITSNSRRSLIGALSPSPSFKGEDGVTTPEKSPEPEAAPVPAPAPEAQAIDIGEVNIQFPDTLLWKRRFVRVDDKGYLVLTPANVDSTGRNMTKRYHLTEFRTPCLPDEDRQELPNSIVLDFLDGSTLQCACESRQGQAAVLESKFLSARYGK